MSVAQSLYSAYDEFIEDIADVAKAHIKDGASPEDAVERAIDDRAIYTEDQIAAIFVNLDATSIADIFFNEVEPEVAQAVLKECL